MPFLTCPSSLRTDPVPFSAHQSHRQSRTHGKFPLAAYRELPPPRRIVLSQTEWCTDVSSPRLSDRNRKRHGFSSSRAHTWPAPVQSIYCARWSRNLRTSLLARWTPIGSWHRTRTIDSLINEIAISMSSHSKILFRSFIRYLIHIRLHNDNQSYPIQSFERMNFEFMRFLIDHW